MPAERLFTVDGSVATPATPISLAEAGLRERSDLQEWVLAHPHILGPDVKIISFEFDRWRSSSGAPQLDRLDVLGLDTEGRLVVAELKRDRAPDTVEMQAIKYAAMASRFTEDVLVEHYRLFRKRHANIDLDEDAASEELVAHAGELDPDQLRQPRIVLVAGAFPPVVTSTVVWLSEMSLDITLQQVQAYRVFDNRTVVSVTQLFPIPDVEEFTVSPQKAEVLAAKENKKRSRERSTVVRLIAAETLEDGAELHLEPTNEVTRDVREQVEAWIAEDPRRGRATWQNVRSKCLVWEADGQAYRPTEVVRIILSEAADLDRGVRGPLWWHTADGSDLVALAGSVTASGFDWSQLHQVLEALPAGTFTTYGELARVVGTAPQPLGQHITSCKTCVNAHRVLAADGRVAQAFRWPDPDRDDSPQALLENEGVTFTGGVADSTRRLTATDLSDLLNKAKGAA